MSIADGPRARRLIVALALSLAIVAPAHRLRTLSTDGAVAALAVGSTVFGRGGRRPAAALIAFFVASSALSKLPGGLPRDAEAARRDARQVLANGGVAALACLAGGDAPGGSLAAAWQGALAAATADTWATEIGVRWGGAPRPTWGRRTLSRGDSGGVTVAGTAGGLLGATLLAVVAGLPDLGSIARTTLAGVAGMLVDSLLGAGLQGRYICRACGALIERRRHCGAPARQVAGLAWLDNDGVNLVATGAGALTGALLTHWGRRPPPG